MCAAPRFGFGGAELGRTACEGDIERWGSINGTMFFGGKYGSTSWLLN